MSSYGPPGPGQPGDPYQQQPYPPQQPYPQGAGYPPPAGPPPGQYGGPTAPYGAPPTAPQKGSGLKIGLIIGGIVLLLICACGGFGTWWLFSSANDLAQEVNDAVKSAGVPTTDTGAPALGKFSKGDCVVNDGTDNKPKLRTAPCGPGTYEVLSLIPLSTDQERCQNDPLYGAPESDSHFVHDGPVDLSDFVLCLKKR